MRKNKSLQEKLAQQGKAVLRNLVLYGAENEKSLELQTMSVGYISKRIKKDIESLKLTANYYHSYSLSSNQVELDHRMFIMGKSLKDGVWLNKRKTKEIAYNVIINPKIEEISSLEEYDWEYCASFPNLRASIKRPESIKVKYMDEEFEEVEKELSGFEARVFQHEVDHLRGLNILNWSVSHGEVELIPGAQTDFPNFDKALAEYKNVLTKMKKDFPEMFDKKKTLKDVNTVNEEDNPAYWNLEKKPGYKTFSREKELMDKLAEAIQQDFAIHAKELLKNQNVDPNLVVGNEPQKEN